MAVEEIIVGRDPEDLKKYGKKGCIFLGKHIVGKGNDFHLTNPVLMDVLRPHIVLITGKRGEGKSYSASVIAEEIMKLPDEVRLNLSCLMIDTMGIFWSMKNPNDKDLLLLNEWGLKPRGFEARNIVPYGLVDFYEKAGITYDGVFSIKPSELSAADWALTFNINLFEPLGILLERVIRKSSEDYSIDDIIDEIERDKRSDDKEKMALENRFVSAKNWGIFSEKATPIEEFLRPGITTILDVSLQEWNVRNLMIGILSREIYQARVSARREEELATIGGEEIKKVPMTWMIFDEVHNFIPSGGETTAATHDMLTLIKQGRQPGISLVLITQRPNKLHEDAISQSDMVISHRLTAKPDLDALSAVMQTYLLLDIRKSISALPKLKGAAVILDDNSERLFNIQVRPKQSWHAGESPVAIKEKATY